MSGIDVTQGPARTRGLPSREALAAVALSGSAILLVAAFLFQHLGGLEPCTLCILQRWPHAAALLLLPALALRLRAAPLAGALVMLVSAGMGGWHVGVEQGWWPGPDACSGVGDISAISPEELLERIMATTAMGCDVVAWEMLGLSMAAWNMLASLGLAGVWVFAQLNPGAGR